MKKSAPNAFYIVFLVGAFFTTCGFIKSSQTKPVQLDREYKIAARSFHLRSLEDMVVSDLQAERDQHKKRFKAQLENADEYGDENQSYLYEVRDGRRQIEQAKVVAKKILFDAVKANWPGIMKSTLNEDVDAQTFAEFVPFLRERLDQLTYSPSGKSPSELVFQLDWAQVIFKKSHGRIISQNWSIDTEGSH